MSSRLALKHFLTFFTLLSPVLTFLILQFLISYRRSHIFKLKYKGSITFIRKSTPEFTPHTSPTLLPPFMQMTFEGKGVKYVFKNGSTKCRRESCVRNVRWFGYRRSKIVYSPRITISLGIQ